MAKGGRKTKVSKLVYRQVTITMFALEEEGIVVREIDGNWSDATADDLDAIRAKIAKVKKDQLTE